MKDAAIDPLVDRVARRIARSLKPDKIIVFGSRVSGEATAESDIDLLVIYSGPKSKREMQLTIHRLFRRPDFSLDVFVMTPQELEEQKSVPNTLAREASERGVVCYG